MKLVLSHLGKLKIYHGKSMYFQKVIPFLLFIISVFFSVEAFNASMNTDVEITEVQIPEIKVPDVKICTLGFIPYGINDEGNLSGLYYDMANLIVTNAGYSSVNNVTPYARIAKRMTFGKTDLTIMFRNPALDDYVDYVAPLPVQEVIAIGLQGSSFNKVSDLSGKVISYIRGAKFNNNIDNNKNIKKHEVIDYTQGIKMLMMGRSNAIIGSLLPIKKAALALEKKENIKIVFGKPLILESRTPWIQLSKKSSNRIDIEKLQQSFLQLQKQGTLNRLKVKYGLPVTP